mgnify:CR=1 FL=1
MDAQQSNFNSIVLVEESQGQIAKNVMQKNNINGMLVHDPAIAMAEVALASQMAINQTAWEGETPKINLIFIQVNMTSTIKQLAASVKKYFPNVDLLELREGQIASLDNSDKLMDSLKEPPIVQPESIDADELSMLLNGEQKGMEEK